MIGYFDTQRVGKVWLIQLVDLFQIYSLIRISLFAGIRWFASTLGLKY